MLVLTIQKRSIAQKMMHGDYKANFWKSEYGCLSPRFTRGYATIKNELEEKIGVTLSESETPIWAWVGVPYIDFHKGVNEDDLVAMFLDIPSSEMVFSDYDKYCSYVEGETNSLDFMLNESEVLGKTKEGNCVQACINRVKPEQILLAVDYTNINSGTVTTVENFYKYWRLILVYQRLLDSRKVAFA